MVVKGAGAILVFALVIWVFWMSYEWLRNKNKGKNEFPVNSLLIPLGLLFLSSCCGSSAEDNQADSFLVQYFGMGMILGSLVSVFLFISLFVKGLAKMIYITDFFSYSYLRDSLEIWHNESKKSFNSHIKAYNLILAIMIALVFIMVVYFVVLVFWPLAIIYLIAVAIDFYR